MGLSDDESKLLKKLLKKKDEPEAPAASRALNISLDLGDEKQVQRAQGLGLLGAFAGSDDDDDDDDNDDDDDDDGKKKPPKKKKPPPEETPKRRGYFNES